VAKNQDIFHPDQILSIDSLKNQSPLIEEVFFSENYKKIYFPVARLLFLPDGSTQSLFSSSRTSAPLKKVPAGQQLEFQEKKYRQALTSYQKEFGQTSDPQMKVELLSSIARVQKKSTLFRDAIKTYHLIARDYNNVQTAGGVPLGLAARSELSSLYLVIEDTLTAIKTFLNLYEDIINRTWQLDKAQYDFFSQHIKESVEDIFSKVPLAGPLQPYQSAFSLLKAEEDKQKNITERLLIFQKNAVGEINAKVTPNPDQLRSSIKRFTIESGDQTYLVSLWNKFTGNESQVNRIWGLLLNTDYLRDSLLRQLIQSNVFSGKTGWIVKGRDDKTIMETGDLPSGPVIAAINFKGGFPPWSVEIYQQSPDLFDTVLISPRGIYFYMFFLLAGILIFGLIMTNRIVAHELELSKMKSDFVSTISHEFKSPLSSIRQLSEMLQSGRVPSEDYRQKYYDVLVEQSERLSLLIDNILDFAKLEEGRKNFDFQMMDIGPRLQEIVSIIQDQVRHNDFVIKVEIEKPLPAIKADRESITQAITNLIDNAIKYSGEARNLIVRAFVENKYLNITVKDFGIGIKKEEIDKIFERFYRGGDELTRTVKGSGLGLTLVKQIVEAHHGKVLVESEPGHGSTFSIRLPLLGI
jgi:signal transduction histidine kinase